MRDETTNPWCVARWILEFFSQLRKRNEAGHAPVPQLFRHRWCHSEKRGAQSPRPTLLPRIKSGEAQRYRWERSGYEAVSFARRTNFLCRNRFLEQFFWSVVSVWWIACSRGLYRYRAFVFGSIIIAITHDQYPPFVYLCKLQSKFSYNTQLYIIMLPQKSNFVNI